MCGLGKEVEEVQLGEGVARGGESFEIGGQGLERTGDIDQRGRGDASKQRADLRACSRTRWIEDNEVGTLALENGDAEEVERGGFDGAEVCEFGSGESADGGLVDLDRGDLGELRGERAGEEADSGVEVEG